MNDSQVMAMMAATLRARSATTKEAAREAVALGLIFGLDVSEHTQEKLGIHVNGEPLPEAWRGVPEHLRTPAYTDDLALLPGRKPR